MTTVVQEPLIIFAIIWRLFITLYPTSRECTGIQKSKETAKVIVSTNGSTKVISTGISLAHKETQSQDARKTHLLQLNITCQDCMQRSQTGNGKHHLFGGPGSEAASFLAFAATCSSVRGSQ